MSTIGRAAVFATLLAASACTLLTSLDGFTGGPPPTTNGMDGAPVDAQAMDAQPRADAGDADTPKCFADPCVVELAAGGEHTCVRLVDGNVYCWGRNEAGQLATDAGGGPRPRLVMQLANVRHLAAGGYGRYDGATCVIVDDGVRCWGSDKERKLGRATDGGEFSPDPAPVEGLSDVVEVVVAGAHGCARGADRVIRCWGKNDSGQLGRGSVSAPDPLAGPWNGGAAEQLAAGRNFSCALLDDGGVVCWGYARDGALGKPDFDGGLATPMRVAGLEPVIELAAHNGDHACARTAGGQVSCWGRNVFGQLGRGTFTAGEAVPAPVPLPQMCKHIAVGGEHTCAILVDDTIWCWGRNSFHGNYSRATLDQSRFSGQIGFAPDGGIDLASATPRQVQGSIARPLSLSLGYAHSCALLEGGSVACWGSNREGELGRPTTPLGNPPDGGYQNLPQPTPGLVQFPPP